MNAKRQRRFILNTLIASVACLLASCDPGESQAAWWQGERERIELEQELALKSYRISQSTGVDFVAFEALSVSVRKTKESLEALRQRRQELEEDVASYESQWTGFRHALLQDQRQRAVGKTFETLKLASGREYEKVTVAQIDDSGVTVRHEAGSARIRFNDLDAAQQVFFGLEADLAMVAAQKEQQETAEYERWIDGQLLVVQDAKDRQTEAARYQQETNQRNHSQLVAKQIAASRERPLAQGPSSFGSGFSRYYHSSSYDRDYTPTYRYYYSGCQNSSRSPSFSGSSSYVGSNRPNAANRSFGSSTQSYGRSSGCSTGATIYNPRTITNTPSASEP